MLQAAYLDMQISIAYTPTVSLSNLES